MDRSRISRANTIDVSSSIGQNNASVAPASAPSITCAAGFDTAALTSQFGAVYHQHSDFIVWIARGSREPVSWMLIVDQPDRRLIFISERALSIAHAAGAALAISTDLDGASCSSASTRSPSRVRLGLPLPSEPFKSAVCGCPRPSARSPSRVRLRLPWPFEPLSPPSVDLPIN